MSVESLIHILSDGELHSGSEIADRLKVSRTAVWKQLQRLAPFGLEVERIRGHGYRLTRPLDLLQEQHILSYLGEPQRDRLEMAVMGLVESTNNQIREIDSGAKPYSLCLAEQQTAGRGRRGRSWISPFGQNLYMSLGFRLRRGWAGVDGLSLVAGLAVVNALEAMGVGSGLALKWPNDIWLNERKLGGILIELAGEAQSDCRVVLGLGLNVHMNEGSSSGIDQPWNSLALEGRVPSGGKSRLAAELVSALMDNLDRFERDGFERFRDSWAEYDALRGRPVRILDTGEEGIGQGVDDKGAYLIRLPGELRVCTSGEMSLRSGQ